MQDDDFYDEGHSVNEKVSASDTNDKKKTSTIVKKDTLWQTLIGDLALTYEQDEKLKSLYK